jgi:hypothetical protein
MVPTLAARTDQRSTDLAPGDTGAIVVYGDFNCPWSYLASRRAAVLESAGVAVDWRAVEHDPWRPRRFADSSTRFACVREEMDQVMAALLPGERLPFALAGFVPHTMPAVSGYAEAYRAGVGPAVRRLLFRAFWMHGMDLGAAETVRTLLADTVRSGSSPSDLVREWGYAVDISGGPLTTSAWNLVRGWAAGWRDTGKEVVPTVVVDESTLFGVEAVEWLGREIARRGLDPSAVPAPAVPPRPRISVLASRSWVSQHGNRWLADYRAAHRRPQLPSSA